MSKTMTSTVRKRGAAALRQMRAKRRIHCNVFQTNLMLLTDVITRALLRKMYNQSEITAMRFLQQTFFSIPAAPLINLKKKAAAAREREKREEKMGAIWE